MRMWDSTTSRFACIALALLPLVGSLTACHKSDFPQYAPGYREFAYVANTGSGTVSILDVVNVRLDRELAVGLNPVAVAASSLRNEIYVVNQGSDKALGSLAVINAETNSVLGAIPLHKLPASIDIDSKTDLAYIANTGSNTVSVVDLKGRHELAQIGTGEEPVSTRLSPDGKTLVVGNRKGNSVSVIDTTSRSVRAVFSGCPGASDAVILPDSSKAFVACSAGHQAMAIILKQSKPDQPATRADQVEALIDLGKGPVQLALKPDGGELFAINSLSNTISEVVTSTNDVGGAYLIGMGPSRGLVTSNNSLLYVSNQNSQQVSIYAIEDGKQRGAIHVGEGPTAMAFSTAGHLLFVADTRSNDVAVVRTSSRSLFTLLPAGRSPSAIVVKSFTVK